VQIGDAIQAARKLGWRCVFLVPARACGRPRPDPH
jgi:hypothetical protein